MSNFQKMYILKGTVLYGAEQHIHNYSTVPILINKIPIWLKLTGTFSELIMYLTVNCNNYSSFECHSNSFFIN